MIRAQDVFGAAALFGYAHVIQSNVEVSRLPGRENLFSDEERQRLLELADRIMDFGVTWQTDHYTRKIPD